MHNRRHNCLDWLVFVLAFSLAPVLSRAQGEAISPSQATSQVAAEAVRSPESGSVESPVLAPLNRLVKELLQHSPRIQGALRKWQASTKRSSQVAALPNPEFSIGSMGGSNPIPFSNWKPEPLNWSSVMFQQDIPWPGKRALKGEVAAIEADLEAFRYRRVTLETVAELKEAYFQLQYLDRSAEILERYRNLVEKFARIAEARYGVGDGLQTDVLRAQVEISLVVERLEVVDGRRESVRSRLNSLLNRRLEQQLPAPNPIEKAFIPLPFSLEELYLSGRESNPEVKIQRLEIRKANSQFSLSKKQVFPDLTFSASYFLRSQPLDNMYEYRLGLKLPLFFWRKERRGIEEKALDQRRSQHDYQDKLQEVVFWIKDAYINARTAARLAELYQKGIIPQSLAALDSALASYEVGAADFLTLLDNALTVLNYEVQYQEELRDYFQSLVRLETLLDTVLVR